MQRRTLWLIVGIAGGALVLLGFAGGFLGLALLFTGGDVLTAAETLPVAGTVALGLGLGVPLALHGWAGWRGWPSRPFGPSRGRWMWIALVLLAGLGTVVSSLPMAPALWLPPIHVLMMALPPLIVLRLVGWALHGVGGSWREVVAGMAGGGALGLGGSLAGEVLVAFAFIVLTTAIVLTMPGGTERIASLVKDLQDPAWVTDLDSLLPFLLSPAVAIPVLVLFAIPVPLIEEACKTLAAGVVARWIRPHPARAFLWGVAGGAGFALAENLFSGALGGAEGWALGAVARFGATVMHCLTAGLVGWGWGQLWTAGRPLRLLGSYLVAVAIHGLWNAAAVGAALLSASASAHEGDEFWLTITSFGTLACLGLLGLLTAAFYLVLPVAGRRLAAGTERSQQGAAGSAELFVPVSSEAPASGP
jgi:RsiW-degrading membrane proteinase PrsW (M82 family)